MVRNSKIEWTEDTWNPIAGCSKVSEGCRNCYALPMTVRLAHNPGLPAETRELYRRAVKQLDDGRWTWTGEVVFIERRLEQLQRWRAPRRIFVASLSDLFHPHLEANRVCQIYDAMQLAQQHTFVVCTKRPERIVPVLYGEEGRFYLGGGDYQRNVWHLTTAENQPAADERIPRLLELRSKASGWPVLGVSIEPMLGPMDLRDIRTDVTAIDALTGDHGVIRPLRGRSDLKLDWIICGGESGPAARPLHPVWARSIRDQCQAAGTAFFLKQRGEFVTLPEVGALGVKLSIVDAMNANAIGMGYVRVGKKRAGRMLDGREWNEMPAIREVP